MTDTTTKPEKTEAVVAHEKVLRLECLKLSAMPDTSAPLVLARASAYAAFVIGE